MGGWSGDSSLLVLGSHRAQHTVYSAPVSSTGWHGSPGTLSCYPGARGKDVLVEVTDFHILLGVGQNSCPI